jgi:hypothetical protein
MKKKLLCVYPTDWTEEQSLEPFMSAMKERHIVVHVDRTMSKPSEVGLFLAHHCANQPSLSDCPVISLHDLGQAHNVWPHFWIKEPWVDYAYGILPNRFWEKMYNSTADSSLKPRLGVRTLGWPKSDFAIRDRLSRPRGASPFRNKSDILTVLYAPSWEYDNQQDKFIKAIKDLPVHILIKQQFFTGMGHLDRVMEMAREHHGKWKNVTILDPRTSIFDVLPHADCLVSDESSTMIEGAMIGCVPISVIDWKVPDVNPPRPPSVPFPFVVKVEMSNLPAIIAALTIPETLSQQVEILSSFSDYYTVNPGQSTQAFCDFIYSLL